MDEKTISKGTQTTISDETISIGASALVKDGKTHAFNPTGTTISTGDFKSKVILTFDEVVTEASRVCTYSGPVVSAFVEGSFTVVGTTTIPLGASVTGAASL